MLFSPSAKLSVCERVIISVLFPAKRFFVVEKDLVVNRSPGLIFDLEEAVSFN
jgi:hypothetical protein